MLPICRVPDAEEEETVSTPMSCFVAEGLNSAELCDCFLAPAVHAR